MRRGEAVSDPRDAALAVQWAENSRALRKPALRLPLGIEVVFVAVVVFGAVLTRHWTGLVAAVIPLAGFLWFRWAMGRLGRRIDASLEKNRALAKQFAGTSARPET
jgi:hypothetical protein